MDLFSFTSIIIILFLIIGLYILATGQAEGRAKIVLVVSLLVVFIVILTNINIFKKLKILYHLFGGDYNK